MLSLKKSKKIANIVITDYVIRLVENSGQGLSTIKLVEEEVVPAGIIEHGKIVDEIKFYNFMKRLVEKWKLKHRYVRFYIPNSLVIMRHVDFPGNLQGEEIKEHFMLQIGESLHLPFEKPVFDVHSLPIVVTSNDEVARGKKRTGMLFAAPKEEIIKYTEIFADVSLKPIAADVQALGVYRYFYHMDRPTREKVYMFFELNLTSTNLSIFYDHQLEFLRYQDLDLEKNDWEASRGYNKSLMWTFEGNNTQMLGTIDDQIRELDRIMNFYRYSLSKNKMAVTDIVILGDYPNLGSVAEKIENEYGVPTTLLTGFLSKAKQEEAGTRFVPALGLALKGDL